MNFIDESSNAYRLSHSKAVARFNSYVRHVFFTRFPLYCIQQRIRHWLRLYLHALKNKWSNVMQYFRTLYSIIENNIDEDDGIDNAVHKFSHFYWSLLNAFVRAVSVSHRFDRLCGMRDESVCYHRSKSIIQSRCGIELLVYLCMWELGEWHRRVSLEPRFHIVLSTTHMKSWLFDFGTTTYNSARWMHRKAKKKKNGPTNHRSLWLISMSLYNASPPIGILSTKCGVHKSDPYQHCSLDYKIRVRKSHMNTFIIHIERIIHVQLIPIWAKRTQSDAFNQIMVGLSATIHGRQRACDEAIAQNQRRIINNQFD